VGGQERLGDDKLPAGSPLTGDWQAVVRPGMIDEPIPALA